MVRTAGLAAALAVWAAPLAAADYHVTRYDDPTPDGCTPGSCSLREAVIAANGDATKDRILLSKGIYFLTLTGDEDLAASGDLDLREDVDIVGVGANLTQIYAGENFPVIQIIGAGTVASFFHLSITGGKSGTAAGIGIAGGTLVMDDCELFGNVDGWAILTGTGSDVTLTNTTIEDNHAGLACIQSICSLQNVTLVNNTTQTLFNQGNVGVGSSMSCNHCTIYSDDQNDVVISLDGANSGLVLSNSAIEGKCQITNGSVLTSLGGNIEAGAETCDLVGDNDIDGAISAGLDAIDENGGSTRTMLPQEDGPSADNALTANCPALDQRGFARPFDGDSTPGALCDSGAAEFGSPRPDIPLFIDGFEQGNTSAWETFD